MRVGYVIYNERPMSGLIRSQVIGLLKEIKRQRPDINITLVALWQPWVPILHRKHLRSMTVEMAAAGIDFESYPLAIPSRYFFLNPTLFSAVRSWGKLVLRRLLARRFDIVHCRGYFASVITAELKAELGYRCIFDMRSLFADEHVSIGTWSRASAAYRMWKSLEKLTVSLSDATVGVSLPMVKSICDISPRANAVYVPLCADTDVLKFTPQERADRRKARRWDDRLVVAYVGSLSMAGWNNIHTYARYFAAILAVRPEAHFLVLTQSQGLDFETVFAGFGIIGSQYTVGTAAGREMAHWLSAADVGIQVMSGGADSHTRLGVKFVEYLSCGLPVIVNSNVGAAAEVVTAHGVGGVIDIDGPASSLDALKELLSRTHGLRDKCQTIARTQFSVTACARRYVELYDELAGTGNGASLPGREE